ncbi:MAG TPA: BamA/TamA family outer membrane protein [Ohtaekwangia sp.]|uniref:BamA/TamA family outer membrane protein n=1 Tax=Ohtaekwangia sp. TaxID=2066019 RepID=UPI002F91FAE6
MRSLLKYPLRKTWAALCLSYIPSLLFAAEIKVILTANSADLADKTELFTVIDQYCSTTTVPVIWVLNGDVFPEITTQAEVEAWGRAASQLLDKYTQLTILINQGEREWKDSGKDGWQAVQQLEKYIKKIRHPRLVYFLDNGCPGPWLYSVPQYLDVIVFNSQWWNHPYDKPISYMNACGIADEGVFLEKINDMLDESKNRNVLLLSHYPLMSLGKYGGRFPASSYLWPPVAGSARVSFRQNIGTSKDIVNEHFDGFRRKLNDMIGDYSSLIMASGHEKNHSVLKEGNNFYINSGSLHEGDFIANSNQALLAFDHGGFVELTYDTLGQVAYRYMQWNKQQLSLVKGDVLINPSRTEATTSSANSIANDSREQVIIAGPEYDISAWGRLWLGTHYRHSWIAPVHVTQLDMDTTFQGLTVTKKGGGRQTTSLKMTGGNGKEYVFRSVNKDPSKALAHAVRGTLVSQLIKDQTTTQEPYGALAASYMLDKIGILHARPVLYSLPKGGRLGEYSAMYGNLFGMLEDSPTDKIQKDKIFGGADHIERSYKLFQKLYEDHDNHVDRLEFCRARVFDILVGDWGKHEDNWKWAGYKNNGGIVYRPIPRDRDHVFSRWDGILPFLADREWAKESGENFDYKIKGLRSLMHQARHMDRLLGNQLTRNDWIEAAKEIQNSISNEDIEQAVRKMPAEVYIPDGKEITAKLQARIRELPRYAERYYEMLAKEVDIVGSNKAEYFQVTRNADGTVDVVMCDLDHGKPDFEKVYFRRKFIPAETKEIRLYGLTNDDVFVVTGKADESILLRIINGDAGDRITDDSFVKGSSHKTLLYQQGENTVQAGGEVNRVIPKDKNLYHYQRTAFAYNTYFPFILLSYNPFTGLALNTRVTFTNHNFSKPAFSVKHSIAASVSTRGNYEIGYRNQLRYLVGKWDGISEINLSRPLNYNYFFGIGNNTSRNSTESKAFYRAMYNSFLVRAGLTRTFWKQSNITILAAFESDEGIARENTFLSENPNVFGMQKLNMTSLKAMLNLDFRDDRFLPQRGFRFAWNEEVIHLHESSDNISSISFAEVEHYLSTYNRNPVTLGIRAGGGITTGDLPFYKLFSLGQLDDLHGFRRNRFTGQSKAYLNTELRWQIVETHNNFIPVKIGIRTFYDVGRVWADGDAKSADYWHEGYGAGFYVTPFTNQFSFNVNVGTSKEESLLLMFGIGGSF